MNKEKKFELKDKVRVVNVPEYDAFYHVTGIILGMSWYAKQNVYIVLLDNPTEHALAITVEESHLQLEPHRESSSI